MMIPRVLKVTGKVEDSSGTFTLDLSAHDTLPLPRFLPGQFSMIYCFGGGEVPISFSGNPGDENKNVHTIRAVGAVTSGITRLEVGDYLGVRGPFGTGWPIDKLKDKELIIIAGGLGLAPLRPVVYEYLSGKLPVKKLDILYGARSPDEILYKDDLRKWRETIPINITVDHANRNWNGNVGVVTNLVQAVTFSKEKTVAFICGPEVMMRFTIQALLQKGLQKSSIYLSMERNMKCATGHCGHCQWGPEFICKNGPVFQYDEVEKWFQIREL